MSKLCPSTYFRKSSTVLFQPCLGLIYRLISPNMVYTLICHVYALPDATSISKVKNKLIEASRVYRHDKETLGWHVMQDVRDERKFTIVERFEKESVSNLCKLILYWYWMGALVRLRNHWDTLTSHRVRHIIWKIHIGRRSILMSSHCLLSQLKF